MSKPHFVKVTLGERRRKFIERLAKKERRSISSMINTLIDEALAARGVNLSVLNADTIAELVQANYQKLVKAEVKNLKAIADGERPNDTALAQIAEALEMNEEDLQALCDQTFE
jgi:uncharacterized protein YegL